MKEFQIKRTALSGLVRFLFSSAMFARPNSPIVPDRFSCHKNV
jgi:hypothetical protein